MVFSAGIGRLVVRVKRSSFTSACELVNVLGTHPLTLMPVCEALKKFSRLLPATNMRSWVADS